MQLGNNWERKVPHKHMVIRTFKNSIQKKKKRILYKIWLCKRNKEVRAAQAVLHDTTSLDGAYSWVQVPDSPLIGYTLVS